MKKLLAMVLALVMTLSLAVSANAAFEDAKDINATYAEAVDVLAGMKVFQGYDNGKTFKPQGDITRAEVAAIVYRIYTADVKDSYVKNYETYNKFSDMAGAGWAKGYIGYCANAALVKGYPNGTFQPSGKVTGYEVLAMILRAVGYDKNNEFTGTDWALHVAQIAEQNKILKNVKGIDLSAPASRELVAELLFQAIQVPTVTYTAAFGYQDVSLTADKKTDKLVKANSSLGYKNFKLVSGNDSDDWGRPVTVWAKDANDNGEYDAKKDTTVYATVVATPDAAFNVATTECDICEALGVKKTAKIVEIYDNGKLTKDTDTLTATETKNKLGAQGEQIEFYENADGDYRMVIIDTYLAKVNDVVEEKLDSKNHVSRDAYLELHVYNIGTATNKVNDQDNSDNYTVKYVKGNDYAEDDWVLVNVNKEATTKIILKANASATPVDLVETVSKADSFEGAQSDIWYAANKHTVDGKDYNDAEKFLLDEAGKRSSDKYTWFLDQFGNLIGVVGIDNTNYAVLKSIKFVDKNDGAAEAVLVYMDGTEATVNVKSIDGLSVADDSNTYDGTKTVVSALDSNKEFTGDFSKDFDDASAEVGDTYKDAEFRAEEKQEQNKWTVTSAEALVSTYAKYNKAYNGMALYKVETDKDGDVSLQGYQVVNYAPVATINANSTVMQKYNAAGTETAGKVTLSDNTQFIVRETNDKNEYVYTTYTLKTLPAYADKSLEVYYTTGANGFVNRVYIKCATDESAFPAFVFMPKSDDSNYKWHVDSDYADGGYYQGYIYVDGELTWVKMSDEAGKTLVANQGKLFAATWESAGKNANYGRLETVKLVNEEKDNIWTNNTVVADYVYRGTLDGNILETRKANGTVENSWRIDDAKVISVDGSVDKLTSSVVKDNSVWVVSKETKREGVADYIFVGYEKLSESVIPTVTSKDGVVSYDEKTKTYTLTLAADYDKDDAVATITGDAALTLVMSASDNNKYQVNKTTDTILVRQAGQSRDVKVYNEAGTAEESYILKLAATNVAPVVTLKTITFTDNKFTVGFSSDKAIAQADYDNYVITIKSANGAAVAEATIAASDTANGGGDWTANTNYTASVANAGDVAHNQDFKVTLTLYKGETVVGSSVETLLHLA